MSLPGGAREPVDPDAGRALRAPVPLVRGQLDVLAVIAAGGGLGALARWGLALAVPHRTGAFPVSTLVTNLVGSLLLGALMVVVTDVRPGSRYLRPFAGVGVLGGFTTFSTATGDVHAMADAGRLPLAALYLLLSVVGGLLAVAVGLAAARRLVRRRPAGARS
ncbi:fluoride efflux transporter FluC [Angustibacter aerolatus]